MLDFLITYLLVSVAVAVLAFLVWLIVHEYEDSESLRVRKWSSRVALLAFLWPYWFLWIVVSTFQKILRDALGGSEK